MEARKDGSDPHSCDFTFATSGGNVINTGTNFFDVTFLENILRIMKARMDRSNPNTCDFTFATSSEIAGVRV